MNHRCRVCREGFSYAHDRHNHELSCIGGAAKRDPAAPCYFCLAKPGARHVVDCPADGRDPWAEQTEEKPATPPARWVLGMDNGIGEAVVWTEHLGNFSLGEE
jgi:hypothetical protein